MSRYSGLMVGGQKPKATCRRGHPLVVGNLYVYPSGKRTCLRCKRGLARRARLVRDDPNYVPGDEYRA